MTQQTANGFNDKLSHESQRRIARSCVPLLPSQQSRVTGDYNDSSRRESRMESRAGSYQCWGRQAPSHPPCPSLPVLHLSLESLSQMQELYYSYEDCLRNAYSM